MRENWQPCAETVARLAEEQREVNRRRAETFKE
jgi:hypothetical protein